MSDMMILQELVFTPQDEGVLAVSMVSDPAIEKEFLAFAVPDKWFYTLRPDEAGAMTIQTSHNMCKKYAKGDAVGYSAKTIKGWTRFLRYKGWGFTDDAYMILQNFPNAGTDLGNVMFGCRHMLKKKENFHRNFSFQYEFKAAKGKSRRIKGPVMVGNKHMLRPPEDLDGQHWGYVWFSNETVEQLQKAYGINSSATFLHQADISKNMIMTKSWVDKSDPLHWEWWAEYYVLSDFLWQQIEDKQVLGFSVEVSVSRKH